MELSVEETAALLHVRPSTVRSRLRAGELRRAAGAGAVRVVLEPGDYIRSEDAAAILGLSPTTVRAAIDRGELAGRRSRRGRWTVRLESVLADQRASEESRRLLELGPAPAVDDDEPPAERRAGRHNVFVQLDDRELDTLELAAARHGSKRAAVAVALSALVEQDATPGDVAELRVERDTYRDRCEQLERDLQLLAGVARRQVVDELYCPQCETFVPLDQWGYARDADGRIEVYHRKHGHRGHSRMRTGSVMARRTAAGDEQPASE